jgi:hypothetical protein
MFGSYNSSGGGPMVGFYYGRSSISASLIWMEITAIGAMPTFRVDLPSRDQRVVSFLQVSAPISRRKSLITTSIQTPNGAIETKYDGLTKGIHFSIGADIQLWENLQLTTSAGLGHNWIHYIDFPNPDYDYDLATTNLQFGLTYRIPFRKEEKTERLEPDTDPDFWLGIQAESALPVIFATVTNSGATYYHPYAEARLTPHMRLRASAWIGPQSVIAASDTSTRWGVHGLGLAARFYSLQLRRLHFFHLIGIELVPRRFSPLHHNNLHLANGFSYDIAHRVNLEAGMNLHINTDDYYMSPYFGVAVPIVLRKQTRETSGM